MALLGGPTSKLIGFAEFDQSIKVINICSKVIGVGGATAAAFVGEQVFVSGFGNLNYIHQSSAVF